MYQVSQQVLDRNFVKKKSGKNSSKFVYILAKQCRSHFNLTNFFTKKFKIIILRSKTFNLKLVRTPSIIPQLYAHMAALCFKR